jgi:uncharacterized protein (TIGR02271 family)
MAITPRKASDARGTESRAGEEPRLDRANSNRQSLAFEGTVDRTPTGWIVRVPVRAEEVWVDKQTFVAEEVRVSRDEQVRTKEVEGQTRREELRVDDVPKPKRARTPRGPQAP